ncbi:ECF RNA polymerase sigma factor SigW [compost metagenome]
MALLHSLMTYDTRKTFRPWLNGLIINQVNNWRRKGWRRLRLFIRHNQLFVQPTTKGPDILALESEEKNTLLQQVSRLSSKLRVVIVLRYYQDCTLEEIADTLKIPLGTVKSRHHEALRRLRVNSGMIHLAKEAYIHVD